MDFVKQYNNILGKSFCINTIAKFEKDELKQKGITCKGLDELVKKSLDLHSENWTGEGWAIIYGVLQDALHSSIIKYYEELGDKFFPYPTTNDSGFQIQHYKTNEGKYEFHNDFLIDERGFRTLAYIFYLNDVEEGGETEFYKAEPTAHKAEPTAHKAEPTAHKAEPTAHKAEPTAHNGLKVRAEQGKLLLFPSLWTYAHKGNMPISNDKYIITGWIYSKY